MDKRVELAINKARRERKDSTGIDVRIKSLHDLFENYYERINTFIDDLPEEDIIELSDYSRSFVMRHKGEGLIDVDMDKLKIFMLMLKKLSDEYDVDKVLSYLEATEYGWSNGHYFLNNRCLDTYQYRSEGCCKRLWNVTDSIQVEPMITDLRDVFLDEEYGGITLFIFNYCLASLFCKMLKRNNLFIPFYLQIACERNSTLYMLIEEVVKICDVNAGLYKHCNRLQGYRYCGHAHQPYYPTQSSSKDMDTLARNKDIPIIIAGYENEHNYNVLLREVANLSNKRNALDMNDRFNLYPIFICPEIKSSFGNVFNMDLTDLVVSDEYLSLLEKNEAILASWALELVSRYEDYLFKFHENGVGPINSFSFSLARYIQSVSQEYIYLTPNNSQNVGFLSFFLAGYLDVFRRSCTYTEPRQEGVAYFEAGEEGEENNLDDAINLLIREAEGLLAKLHHRYNPTSSGMDIKDKDARSLAKKIEKCYRDLKIHIRTTSVEIKNDRYIFNVETWMNTKDSDVVHNTETVQRRLKKYECFRADLRDKQSIKLIVAKKSLTDNSLIEILNHDNFMKSKMMIPYAVGFDETGEMCIEDISEFPHLLLAGTSKSGKSTAMMCLLMSIAYRHRNGNVNVVIMDLLGKAESDFNMFNDQPFLSCPVIRKQREGINTVLALYKEMINRLNSDHLSNMPYIVCVIDEFPRLFSGIKDKKLKDSLERALTELLSEGRHANISFVLAAQDPKKEHMVCGIENISARIALNCAHYQYSRTIIGRSGAETLQARGQMIFDSYTGRDKRLQGSFITKREMKKILGEIKKDFVQENQYPFRISINKTDLVESITELSDDLPENYKYSRFDSVEELLPKVILWSLPQNRIANSRIQKSFHIANDKANDILEQMDQMELISKMHGNLGWKVLPENFLKPEIIRLLESCGNTESDIKELLGQRKTQSNMEK